MHAEATRRQTSRNLQLHPGINFSKLEVGGDIGGLVFTAGSVAAVLIGLPSIAPLYIGSLACGVLLAVAIFKWHDCHSRR
jgi:hypothetical protein